MSRLIGSVLVCAVICCTSTANADITLNSGNASFNYDSTSGTGFELVSSIVEVQTDVLENMRFFVAISEGGSTSGVVELVYDGETGDTVNFQDDNSLQTLDPSDMSGTNGSLGDMSVRFSLTEDANGFARLDYDMSVTAAGFFNPAFLGATKLTLISLLDYDGLGAGEVAEANLNGVTVHQGTGTDGKLIAYNDPDLNIGVATSGIILGTGAVNSFKTLPVNQSGLAYSVGHWQEFDLPNLTSQTFLMQGSFGAIPEPTSTCLLGLVALAGLGYRRRK